jgi:phage-related protein
MPGGSARKPLFWIGSSRKDMRRLPVVVQKKFGTLLLDVQYGETPIDASPMRHVGSNHVWEIHEDHDRSTFRAVYTVAFPPAVYVLQVFQKKAKRGIKTPRREVELIRSRLVLARQHARALKATVGRQQ